MERKLNRRQRSMVDMSLWVLLFVLLSMTLAGRMSERPPEVGCVVRNRTVMLHNAKPLPNDRYPYLVEDRYKQNQKWHPFLLQELPRSQKLVYKHAFGETTIDNLIEGAPPLTAHYMFCKRGLFEYKHYISLLSIAKVMKVDKIVFHSEGLPFYDMSEYNDWIQRLYMELPHLVFANMKAANVEKCLDPKRRMRYFSLEVTQNGGIVIGPDTVVKSFDHKLRKDTLKDELMNTVVGGDSFLVFVRKLEKLGPTSVIDCSKPTASSMGCFVPPEYFTPSDVMFTKNEFSELARWLMYGYRTPVVTNVSVDAVVPMVAHYLNLEKKPLSYITYLSILSSANVAKLKYIYIHGVEPTGKYWEDIMKKNIVVFLPEEYGNQIFEIQPKNPRASYIFTASLILIKYGGIFIDNNMIWTSPKPEMWSRFEFTVGGAPSTDSEWPEKMNSGLMAAKQNSFYLRQLLPVARAFDAQLRGDYLSFDEIMYRTYELYPEYVNFKRKFSAKVKCSITGCDHQGFWKDQPKNSFEDFDAVHVSFSDGTKQPENSDDLKTFPKLNSFVGRIQKS